MTEVVYYVAMSLDGYIATTDGGVDWLGPFESGGEDRGYDEFYSSIDSLLMGSRTYKQILSFGDWPYEDTPCWVFSGHPLNAVHADITITDKVPKEVIAELAEQNLRRAWLVGGAELASSFRSAALVSEYIISVIPTILGDGIPLLGTVGLAETVTLLESKQFGDGIVQLRYLKGNDA